MLDSRKCRETKGGVRGCEAVAEARRKTTGTKFDDEIGLLGCRADAAEKSEDRSERRWRKGRNGKNNSGWEGPRDEGWKRKG